MAPPPGTLRVSRYFTALALVLGVLYLIVFLPGTANTPKLGIDLVGGVRVIFTATPPPGEAITATSMEQARQIIEDRINGTGVTASTVQIQGDDQLVVSIPGGTDTDVKRLGQAAQLNFRPLIAPAVPVGCDQDAKARTVSTLSGTSGAATSPSASPSSPSAGRSSAAPTGGAKTGAGAAGSASDSAGPNDAAQRRLAPSTTARASKTPASRAPATTAQASTPAAAPSTAAPQNPNQPCLKNAVQLLEKQIKSMPVTEAQYAKLTQAQKTTIAQALTRLRCDSASTIQPDRAKSFYIACDENKQAAYLLGQVIVPGTQIDEANAVAPNTGGQGGSTQWTVSLTLKDTGKKAWGDWTTAHNTNSSNAADPSTCSRDAQFPCNDFVAFTLDGQVKSAPATNEPIVGQATQISGNFNQGSANALADQLKYGALPLNFRAESNERVSASLGTSQLKAAFLAGGIGLILVVVYSLLYYRALGIVTIASLIVSGLLTYAMIVILGQQIGFTLDLAGIAGLIVALGITADSFVVFFERIKDEVHEGRSVRVAVPRGWVRARRTVVSADIVSFLAAVILYIFASADVRGFAFTLGLSTILDLLVVFIFTHPIVSLLSRSRAFGSPRFTGLNAVRRGGITQTTDAPRGKLAGSARRGGASRGAGRPTRSSSATVLLDKELDSDTDADSGTAETSAGRADVRRDDRHDDRFDDRHDDELDLFEGDRADAVDDRADETADATTDDAPDVATDDTTDETTDDTTDETAHEATDGTADEATDETDRRHTTPAAGTAAERAAARRARLRRQREEGGE